MSTIPTEDSNTGIAFAIVIGASLATGVGASVVFVPSLVKLANQNVLASSLGFSAGIMTYVSFIEIFPKSVIRFKESSFSSDNAFNLGSLSFFGGVMFTMILNFVVHKMISYMHYRSQTGTQVRTRVSVPPRRRPKPADSPEEQAPTRARGDEMQHSGHNTTDSFSAHVDNTDWGMLCLPGCSDDLEFLDYVALSIETTNNKGEERKGGEQDGRGTEVDVESNENINEDALAKKYKDRKLLHMGIMTAVAIGLHNFPEGLATYVAVIDNPSVGAVFSIAIAIHNVPEGLCVALPVYYATGNRRKAFLWGVLSGMTEVLAALVGWLVLSNNYSDSLFGVLFGMVAGMMVTISFRELLPSAHRYDHSDHYVTKSFIAGMTVMGLSLVLFRL